MLMLFIVDEKAYFLYHKYYGKRSFLLSIIDYLINRQQQRKYSKISYLSRSEKQEFSPTGFSVREYRFIFFSFQEKTVTIITDLSRSPYAHNI